MPYLRLDLPGTYLVEVKRELARYDLHFDGETTRQGPNYRDLAAHFTVRRHGDLIGVMEPAKRQLSFTRHRRHADRAHDARGLAALFCRSGTRMPTVRGFEQLAGPVSMVISIK